MWGLGGLYIGPAKHLEGLGGEDYRSWCSAGDPYELTAEGGTDGD